MIDTTAHDAAIATVANKITLGGGSAALIGGVTANDLLTLVGALAAVSGALVNWYYRRRADRRDRELHEAQLAEIRKRTQEK